MEKPLTKRVFNFLLDLPAKREFGKKWITLFKTIVFQGSIGVKLNNLICPFFLSWERAEEGDPCLPSFFYHVINTITRVLAISARHNLLRGLCSDICPGHAICL
jgi:hypothetical protein